MARVKKKKKKAGLGSNFSTRTHKKHPRLLSLFLAGKASVLMEVENLLSCPSGLSATPEEFKKPFTRKIGDYVNSCDPFRDDQDDAKVYGRQYSHIYFTRLTKMSKLVEKRARKKWGENNLGVFSEFMDGYKPRMCFDQM